MVSDTRQFSWRRLYFYWIWNVSHRLMFLNASHHLLTFYQEAEEHLQSRRNSLTEGDHKIRHFNPALGSSLSLFVLVCHDMNSPYHILLHLKLCTSPCLPPPWWTKTFWTYEWKYLFSLSCSFLYYRNSNKKITKKNQVFIQRKNSYTGWGTQVEHPMIIWAKWTDMAIIAPKFLSLCIKISVSLSLHQKSVFLQQMLTNTETYNWWTCKE